MATKTSKEQTDILETAKNQSLLKEVWDFLKVRKAYWLIPLVVMFLLAGILIIFGHSTAAVSPFIYPLF
jgi:hypothetical protein